VRSHDQKSCFHLEDDERARGDGAVPVRFFASSSFPKTGVPAQDTPKGWAKSELFFIQAKEPAPGCMNLSTTTASDRTSANGMVRPCSCPASDGSCRRVPKPFAMRQLILAKRRSGSLSAAPLRCSRGSSALNKRHPLERSGLSDCFKARSRRPANSSNGTGPKCRLMAQQGPKPRLAGMRP
jgi:hypothetical protein